MRDDFTRQTIAEIAKSVGYRCSNPECRRATVGANAAQDGVVTIGVAAHISAASPGGPRYNPAQGQEARRGKDNGIWLCQNCGRLVDADPKKFTVEVLTVWKSTAQQRAFRELVTPNVSAIVEEAARVESIVAADNKAVADSSFQSVFSKVHAAASADLAGHKRAPKWSSEPVELTLRSYDDQTAPPFNISKLPAGLDVAPEATIIAAPGTGKTTTVLQLATHVLAANTTVPLYFRLSEWSAGAWRLFESLHQRSAFRDIRQDDLVQLAQRGRLLLVLDGWNELDPASRKRLRVELDQIRRDWPFVRIVATTRRQALDVPTSGPRIAIEPLSEDQQMGIARAQFGAAGEKIVDSAWRTAGVRELIATPLYLSALLSVGSKGSSPGTKEEVLRLFVEQHELADEHAEALQAILHGCHTQVLTALACQLNASGSTAMAEEYARRVVNTTVSKLRVDGQVAGPAEPLTVLEALASHHTLVRSGANNGTVSFQHQQFQEWFASHKVAELIRASANGDLDARAQLRAAVLDQLAWEESVLFAAERMSREDGGAAVVAHAVRLALPIDPMLAAEMIYRSSDDVWKEVKEDIIAFVDRWHRPGTVDRAVRFMVITGRPEFQSRVWPLASSTDSQIRLPTLRTAPRFRPSVFGSDVRSKIPALPEEARASLLGQIAYQSGVDGMELATELAKTDPSSRVQAEVVQYLQFRRADRHVADLLRSAHDETWALVAERGYAEEIRDPTTISRLQAERDKALAQATEPAERLRLLIEQPAGHPNREAGISSAIADPSFPIRDQRANTSVHLAQERAPAAVLEGLRQRVAGGLELPFQAEDLLASLEVVDHGPIAARILDVGREERNVSTIAILAGPQTVDALVDKFLACAKALEAARNDASLSNEYQRLCGRITATRAASLVAAIKARGDTDDAQVISRLATLVSLHGGRDDRASLLPIEPANKQLIIGMLRKWVQVVISSPGVRRYDLCEVGNAIGRIGFPELLPDLRRLLDEDLARFKKARDGYADARRRGDIQATSDASMRYGNQYREAFVRIGGQEAASIVAAYVEDRVFGFDAAVALKAISDRQLNVSKPSFKRQWPRFDEVAAARAKRASPPKEPPADTLARPIFAAIDRLASPITDKEGQLLTIQIARIGLAMPHSNQDALIDRVMALPQPLNAKRELLAARVLDGQVLDTELVMQAIDEWLAGASQNEQTAWHKRQNTWEIEPWLELLPFTTRPEAVISGLEKVKAFFGSGWRQRWERVLSAAACVPGAKGEALLTTLAAAHKDIAGDFEWMKAILGRGCPSAVLMYVDLYLEGIFGRGPHAIGGWQVGRELAGYAEKFPELEEQLRKRYDAAGAGPGRQMLEHFFGEFGSSDDLIPMVKKYAAGGQAYDGRMDAVVRAVTLRQEPIHEGSTAFYVHPATVSKIRKYLFGLIRGAAHEAALAKRCLVAIDELRDQHGIAANDTRHPDVLSEVPWPPEVGQWFDEPQSAARPTEASPEFGEILPEDIAEFAKMKDVKVESADEWMSVMSKIPEDKVKGAIANLLTEPKKKDWGGESNDHYSSNVTVNGRRTTAAFLFKGPTIFRELTLEMCGKRADQVYRLAKSGAEISVVQHSHLIGEAVRETLRRMVDDPGRSRKYCVLDGQETYRILKAYGFV